MRLDNHASGSLHQYTDQQSIVNGALELPFSFSLDSIKRLWWLIKI